MAAPYDTLPFQRGKTFADGNSDVIGAAKNLHLLGKTYRVPDTVHGCGEDVILRVVMWNHATAHTTSTTTGPFLVGLGTDGTSGSMGRITTAVAGTKGMICKPVDDAYPNGTEIPQYDLFYVVEGGRCDVNTGTTGALTAGISVANATDGTIGVQAATIEFVVGTLEETVDSTDDDIPKVVYINPGLCHGNA